MPSRFPSRMEIDEAMRIVRASVPRQGTGGGSTSTVTVGGGAGSTTQALDDWFPVRITEVNDEDFDETQYAFVEVYHSQDEADVIDLEAGRVAELDEFDDEDEVLKRSPAFLLTGGPLAVDDIALARRSRVEVYTWEIVPLVGGTKREKAFVRCTDAAGPSVWGRGVVLDLARYSANRPYVSLNDRTVLIDDEPVTETCYIGIMASVEGDNAGVGEVTQEGAVYEATYIGELVTPAVVEPGPLYAVMGSRRHIIESEICVDDVPTTVCQEFFVPAPTSIDPIECPEEP